MSDEEIKKQEEQNSSAKALKTGAKMAANAYAGPIGGKAVDIASKTKEGQAILNKGGEIANKMPGVGKATNTLNKSGAIDAIDNDSQLEKDKNSDLSNKTANNNSSNNISNSSSNLNGNSNISDNDSKNANNDDKFDIIEKWKNLPDFVKPLISTSSFFFISIIGIIFAIIIIFLATSAISENLYEALTSAEKSVSNFFDNAVNFFTGNSESRAQKAEEKYYKKLEDVYLEFKQKYGVEIDTTMITATLFYGRTIGDYVDEDFIENGEDYIEDDDEVVDNEEQDNKETTKFYRKARKHIKTLAKYMIVQDTTFNKCVDQAEEGYTVTPESFLEIAKNWTTVSMFSDDYQLFNSVNNFNYVSYESSPNKTFTNAKGEEVTIDEWCNYEDADKILRKYYESDKAYYNEKKNAYDGCIVSKINSCKNGCDNPECISNCDNQDFSSQCSAEKSAMDTAYKYYNENWLIEGLYSDSGNFTCKGTSKWGSLSTFNNPKYYYNHEFDLSLRDKSIEPNFLHKYENLIDNDNVGCTNQPTIKYDYAISLAEGGVYYYKLMIKTPIFEPGTSILGNKLGTIFKYNKSFIERYYPDLLPDNFDELSEEEKLQAQMKIVDEIFLLHYTVTRDRPNRYCVTPDVPTDVVSESVLNDGENYILNDNDILPNTSSRSAFLNSIASTVVNDMQKTGVLSSLTLAQAAIESGNGSSGLAKNYNNYYGMKAGGCAPDDLETKEPTPLKSGEGGNNCTGNAYWNGDIVWMCNKAKTDCGWYRHYSSFSNSTYDHSRLLSTKSYNCQGITDLTQALQCIQNAGYAEDPAYFNKIISAVNEYNLTQFDIGEWDGTVINENGSETIGTKCFESYYLAQLYSGGNLIFNSDGTYMGFGEGTISGIINGERTSLWNTPELNLFWLSSNNLFYASRKSLAKECTWYAHGRGLEILTSNGLDLATAKMYMNPMRGNAGLWFGQNQYFSSSTSVMNPKVGAIAVWSNGSKPGHVAVVESVKYDSSGNAIGVSLSEGGQSLNGFRYTANRDMNYIASHGTYRFVGYVYLLN